MKLIFASKDSAQRFAGYATVDYSSNSESEIVIETSEKELNNLIPNSESSWKNVKEKFVLENGEIGFDGDYSPPDPTSGGS